MDEYTRKGYLEENGYTLIKVNKIRPTGFYLFGKFMHGDSDGHSTAEVHVELEHIIPISKFLAYYMSLSWNKSIDFGSERFDRESIFWEVVGKELKEDPTYEYLYVGVFDWWENNHRYEGSLAMLESYNFIYSDGNQEWFIVPPEEKK